MKTTRCERGSLNRYPHWNHFLTALFVAVMVMISTVPAFAVEATANTREPDAEISISTPDLVEPSADEVGAFPDEVDEVSEPTPEPSAISVSTFEELLDAITSTEKDRKETDGGRNWKQRRDDAVICA